jgi:hypothetical protein
VIFLACGNLSTLRTKLKCIIARASLYTFKRGHTDLRYALYQAALIASYHHGGFRALFTRYLKLKFRHQKCTTL